MADPIIDIVLIDAANAALLDQVAEEVFDHPVRADLLTAFLANPANLLVVAVIDNQVVGMSSGIAYLHPDKPLSLFINEVGVSPRFQRLGIARRMLCCLLGRAHELGCGEAWVATEVGNQAARALYESTGGAEDEDRAVVYVYPLNKAALSLPSDQRQSGADSRQGRGRCGMEPDPSRGA